MNSPRFVSLLVEGTIDELVLRKTIATYTALTVATCYGKKGVADIKKRIANYYAAAAAKPHPLFICLIDLDAAECAVQLRQELLPNPISNSFIFRIAVTEVESWLLADREGIAKFIGAPVNKVPESPDKCLNPKTEIVNLARKYAKEKLKRDLVPAERSSAPVGKGYSTQIIRFIQEQWTPEAAEENSPSFAKTIKALRRLSE